MENWKTNFMNDLMTKRTTYKDMIDFCCDSLILNNDIINGMTAHNMYVDVYCGNNYDEENDRFVDEYQYFIIDENSAERLAEYTNEIVYYNDALSLYILAVTHWGTSWDYVPANWKTPEEDA